MTDADNKAAVEKTVKELGDGSEVASVTDPFTRPRPSARTARSPTRSVTYKVSGMELKDSSRDALENTAHRGAGRRADRRDRR